MKKGKLVPRLRFPEFVGAGEWDVKVLSDVCIINPSNKSLPKTFIYIDLESVESGVLKSKNLIMRDTAPSRAQRLLQEGDVLFQMVRPYQKNNFYCQFDDNEEYVASTGYAQLRACGIEKFLYQLIHTDNFLEKVLTKCTGSNYPAINSTDLAQISTFIPSESEQQKIADCLTSLDELITAENEKLDALKEHKKGLMQQLFPREGESVPRLRFPEFVGDGEWKTYALGEVSKFRRGSFPQPYGLPEWYDENGFPFVQVFDVNDNLRLNQSTKRRISHQAAQQSVYIPEGTLIVTIQGSIGRVAITQYEAYIDRTLLLFEKFLIPLEKYFFAYVLFLLFKEESKKAPGGTIKTITKEVLKDFRISIPTFKEQQKVAVCLSTIDEQIANQTEKVISLTQHKKGLISNLFPEQEQ